MSRRHLMRTLRHLSALSISAEEFVDGECMRKGTPDELELSVYDVEDSEVLQARTEHQAGCTSGPEKKKQIGALMLTDFPEITVSNEDGETGFEFTSARHRIMEFLDRAEMIAIVERALPDKARARSCTVEEIKAYVRARFAEGDPEWVEMSDASKREKWRGFCGAPAAPADPQLRLEDIAARAADTPSPTPEAVSPVAMPEEAAPAPPRPPEGAGS